MDVGTSCARSSARPRGCRCSRSRPCASPWRRRSSRTRRSTSFGRRWPHSAAPAPSASSRTKWSAAWWHAATTPSSQPVASVRSRGSASMVSRKATPPASPISSTCRPGSSATIRRYSRLPSSTPSRWASTHLPRSSAMLASMTSRCGPWTSTIRTGTAYWNPLLRPPKRPHLPVHGMGKTKFWGQKRRSQSYPWPCGWVCARSTGLSRTMREKSSQRARFVLLSLGAIGRPSGMCTTCGPAPGCGWRPSRGSPRPMHSARLGSIGGRPCGKFAR